MTLHNKKDVENALLLIASVRAALKNGVKHFDQSGNPLDTEKEILDYLTQGNQVTCDETNRVPVTTDEEEFELVKTAFASRVGVQIASKVHHRGH